MNEENIVNSHENKDGISPMPEIEEEVSWGTFIKDIIKFTLLSLIVVVPIRVFIAQPFLVSGSSMKPTFHDGEYLIVDEVSYYLSKPARGDVVVFRYPYDRSKYFIKRIIGLPDETVEIDQSKIFIKNKENPEGFLLNESYVTDKNWGTRKSSMTLSNKEYFVMGDNRNASSDSREWGALADEFITGHVKLRLLPITKVEVSPGAVEKFTN
ncbi:MAG: signal peptidase I [bacterium]|nr:signal peptidase I [bacterium]